MAGYVTGLLGLVLGVSGCSTLIQQTDHGRWVEVGDETKLTLHEPVLIPPGRARVFFKNGRLSRTGASYQTACALETKALAGDAPTRIPPGVFKITRAQHYWAEVAAAFRDWGVYLQLAELSDGSGQPMIQTGYRFWLAQTTEPKLLHLTCIGILAEPAEAYPPSMRSMQQALGDIATLNLL